jgi:hypothetical protein
MYWTMNIKFQTWIRVNFSMISLVRGIAATRATKFNGQRQLAPLPVLDNTIHINLDNSPLTFLLYYKQFF